jgi:hypothetical protein
MLRFRSLLPLFVLTACGSPPPAEPASAPLARPAAEPPIDVSAVPEPAGLVVIGRVTKPDAIVAAAASWTKLPLPAGRELVRSIADDAIADVVDTAQPVDFAVTAALGRRGADVTGAFSIGVRQFELAKAKLAQAHKGTPLANGSIKFSGIKRASQGAEEDEDDAFVCVLAHAPNGARLVCGEGPGTETLTPYLARTLSREQWPADVHVELRPEPVRGPLDELRGTLPVLVRSLAGTQSQTMRELVDAGAGEALDFVTDLQRLSLDASVADTGIVAKTRFDFQGTKSTIARIMTASDRAGPPPAAFGHLPAETDLAFFGRGSDPKLFDRPRELIGKVMLEAADGAGMPEPERKAARDIVDRMLMLFSTGEGVYGKGFDAAALDKALKARSAVKEGDALAESDAGRAVVEQVVGWHLYRTSEPIARVAPILKDLSALWNKPAFATWAKANSKEVPRIKVAPAIAGTTLPKDAVHLEITVPLVPLELPPPPNARLAKPKTAPRKPTVVHLYAIPDGPGTWLGFGIDGKLALQRALASLATAPDTNTIAKVSGHEALNEGKVTSAGFATVRAFAVLAAASDRKDPTPYTALASLPSKGTTPILFFGNAEPPSARARAGSSVGTMRLSRATIEDVVKLAMSMR